MTQLRVTVGKCYATQNLTILVFMINSAVTRIKMCLNQPARILLQTFDALNQVWVTLARDGQSSCF